MEVAPVDSTTNRPKTDIRIKDVTIFVDPFEEFMSKQKSTNKEAGTTAEAPKKGDTDSHVDDNSVTWTGKRVRGWGDSDTSGSGVADVGKYLKAALAEQNSRKGADEDEIVEFVDEPEAAPRKKFKGGGGFGNFEGW